MFYTYPLHIIEINYTLKIKYGGYSFLFQQVI